MPLPYRAIIPGGYYSSNPTDKSMPVSIRSNNPGAVNGAAWEKSEPGYVTEIAYDPKHPENKTTVFASPEQGVAIWYKLLQKYQGSGIHTLGGIIRRYGGGQNYENYVNTVEAFSGLTDTTDIPLNGDDAKLLKFAKAMFHVEAGKATPLSDAQIIYGFNLARGIATADKIPHKSLLDTFLEWVGSFFGDKDEAPKWYRLAESELGFHEVGVNRGIERYLTAAQTGNLGDPWCAIFVNAMLEKSGVHGTRSAMARSFEGSGHFVKLSGPALGAIVTMWRGSPQAGTGHCFFYDGENDWGIRGIAGNENDGVVRAYHDRSRITGYWWPVNEPHPKTGRIVVANSDGASNNHSEV
jgi:uncharacterized protein (TIGR02594 family)